MLKYLGDGTLAVVLGSAQVIVACKGTFPKPRSCRDILGDMEATTQRKVFGLAEDPDTQVVLPAQVKSGNIASLTRGTLQLT